MRKVVGTTDTLLGRLFDIFIQLLICLSLITFSLDTLPNLSDKQYSVLRWIEIFTVLVFTIEYLLRVYTAISRAKFIFSFFGVVDLLAILPFYFVAGLDLRAIRVFRLFRLIRVLKLARYSQAVQRFHRAFIIAREEIILFFSVALLILYLAGVGIFYFENTAQPDVFTSVFHSLWWSVVTLTTVGYGDMYPVTVGGKCFTFIVLGVGLAVVSVPAGLVASALSKARELDE